MNPGFIERSLFLFSLMLTLGAVWMLMPSGANIAPESAALSIVIAWLVTVFAHESGHVIAGQIAGFRLLEVAVGPVRVHWTGRQFHLGVNRRNPLAGYSVSLPIARGGVAARLALTTIGGPLGNLLLAVLAWLLLLALTGGHPHRAATSDAEYFLAAVAVFSAIYVPANLLPFRGSARGFIPDGRQIITYLLRTQDYRRQEALAILHAEDRILGTLPEAWDAGAIENAIALRDGSESEMNALFYAFLHARDSGRAGDAERHLDALLDWCEHHPQSRWSGPYILKALFEAERGNVESARRWQARAGRRLDADDRRMIAGAIHLAEGNMTAACEEIEGALADLRRHMDRVGAWGSFKASERRLLHMARQCEESGQS